MEIKKYDDMKNVSDNLEGANSMVRRLSKTTLT
uniref:Uncharacterized protein n=1 Tax=Siphoviridae sp. cteLh2 TaxID=2825590 RepID=A0A8S5U629_9CAUD|nr:MAG TPA: hypothetical protein [Siphoviridae sp. cteLh2]